MVVRNVSGGGLSRSSALLLIDANLPPQEWESHARLLVVARGVLGGGLSRSFALLIDANFRRNGKFGRIFVVARVVLDGGLSESSALLFIDADFRRNEKVVQDFLWWQEWYLLEVC